MVEVPKEQRQLLTGKKAREIMAKFKGKLFAPPKEAPSNEVLVFARPTQALAAAKRQVVRATMARPPKSMRLPFSGSLFVPRMIHGLVVAKGKGLKGASSCSHRRERGVSS